MEYRGIELHENIVLYMNLGKTKEQQIKKSLDKLYYELKETSYKLVGDYKGNSINMDLICDKGHSFPMRPNAFISRPNQLGQRCPKCSGKCPVQAKENFIKLVEANGHEILDYKGSSKKALINFKCEHEPRLLLPGDYRKGIRCNKCNNTCPEQAKDNFYKEVEKAGYKRLGNYEGGLKRVALLCDKGHTCRLQPTGFVHRGDRCKKCGNVTAKKKWSGKAEESFIEMLSKNGHVLASPYEHARKPVLVDFLCKHKPQPIRPNDYKNGRRCRICAKSRGEIIIYEWLLGNGYDFKMEYKLPKKRWLYDFYIPSKNLIIEVQGKQHSGKSFYNSVNTNKRGRRTLKQEQENDLKKREYAVSLGYQYLEVEYREGKPVLALERFLEQFQWIRKGSASIKPEHEQLTLF